MHWKNCSIMPGSGSKADAWAEALEAEADDLSSPRVLLVRVLAARAPRKSPINSL